jgi:pyruvate/2-oxoglutarate/acetoin dehydrogenase E1 component
MLPPLPLDPRFRGGDDKQFKLRASFESDFDGEDQTMRELTYNEAAVEAVAEEMRRDPKIFYMSTDAIAPLLREFGAERVRATPITEAALTGMAIGAAGCGFRPIVDWRQVTFCFVAMDQIVNQAAKIHYMFGGQVTFPILYRAAVGGGGLVAAQHSQSPYSMFMNVAGLKMFLPSTPYDIKGLLKTAIRDNNPVISFESGRLMTRKGPGPDEDYTVPLGKADIKREGNDVTVVALAWLVHEALAAAEELASEGISVEVVDPRTLVPLDAATSSVQKTGRLVIADEAGPTAGFSAEVAAVATEDPATFVRLQAPVKRVCALQVPIPYSPVLENHVFPDRKRIIAGVREVLQGRRPAVAA